jgi:hypothetical protein
MKKLIVLAIIMGVMVLVAALAHAQAPANDLKPTFISPTPGLYVNGWPAFTVSYPKEWVEQPLVLPVEVYRAAPPAWPNDPAFIVRSFAGPADISGSADLLVGFLGQQGYKDIKVLYDKPSQLQDGTPAREAELEWVYPGGPKVNTFMVATKKDDVWIMATLTSARMIGDDLKSIAYSLKVPRGKQEPVKVPPDVQAFLDKFCSDVNSGDAGRIMTNYSDRYLDHGMGKARMEQWYRSDPQSPIQSGITSADVTLTIFEPQGNKAYLAGFFGGKLKSGAPCLASPINNNQLIKENGQWRWYGNQK